MKAKKVVYKDRYLLATGYPCFSCAAAGQAPRMHRTRWGIGGAYISPINEFAQGDRSMPRYRLVLERIG